VTASLPWYQLLHRLDTMLQLPLLLSWPQDATQNTKPHQYDYSFSWNSHPLLQYLEYNIAQHHQSLSPQSLHSPDYTTVLSSIPWYFFLPKQRPTKTQAPKLNPSPYLSIYYLLHTKQLRTANIDPTLTITFTMAHLPALSTIFKVWNRIWHTHSSYPYCTTPQPNTSNKNLLCPP